MTRDALGLRFRVDGTQGLGDRGRHQADHRRDDCREREVVNGDQRPAELRLRDDEVETAGEREREAHALDGAEQRSSATFDPGEASEAGHPLAGGDADTSPQDTEPEAERTSLPEVESTHLADEHEKDHVHPEREARADYQRAPIPALDAGSDFLYRLHVNSPS